MLVPVIVGNEIIDDCWLIVWQFKRCCACSCFLCANPIPRGSAHPDVARLWDGIGSLRGSATIQGVILQAVGCCYGAVAGCVIQNFLCYATVIVFFLLSRSLTYLPILTFFIT